MGLRLGGLSSGLDTQALIDSLLAVEGLPLARAEQRKADLELEKSIFLDLNTKILALREAVTDIDNLSSGLSGPSIDEELLAYVASSSDETAISATATSGASPGAFNVNVTQLASVARHITTAFSSETDIIANAGETLSIDFGGDAPIEITVGAAGASLADLRSQINADLANDGAVRADVIFDGTGHRLIISGTQTGAVNDVSVSTTISGEGLEPFLDAGLSVSAADAQLELFGLSITRPSNNVSDAIPGVSLTLHSVTTIPVEIQIERDDSAIQEKLQTFVDAYNEIIDIVVEQSRFDPEAEQAGVLSGDPTLRQIEQTLQRTLVQQFNFTNNPFTSLGQIGIDIDTDGRLTLDQEALTEALDTDVLGVRELLSGEGVVDGIPEMPNDGPLVALARLLEPITRVGALSDQHGILKSRDEGYETRIAAIDRQIENLERRLERREEFLILQFTRLETSLAQLQNQGNSLSALVTQTTRRT